MHLECHAKRMGPAILPKSTGPQLLVPTNFVRLAPKYTLKIFQDRVILSQCIVAPLSASLTLFLLHRLRENTPSLVSLPSHPRQSSSMHIRLHTFSQSRSIQPDIVRYIFP